jgi:signal transduction histidine kinase
LISVLEDVLLLVQNEALLVLGVIGYAWLRPRLAGLPWWRRELAEGAVCACLAILVMSAGSSPSAGMRNDSRVSVLVLATLFGGPLAGAVTAGAELAYRVALGGPGIWPAASRILLAVAISLLLRRHAARERSPVGYAALPAYGLVATAVGMLGYLALPARAWLLGTPIDAALAVMRHAIASSLPIETVMFVVLGAIVLFVERSVRLARTIAQSEARLRSIIDNLPDALAVLGDDGQPLLGNRRHAELGRRATDWSAAARPLLDAAAAAARAEGRPAQTGPLLIQDGDREAWLDATYFPIADPAGATAETGVLFTDVTAQMQAREALERRETALRRHQQALTEIMRDNASGDRPIELAIRSLLETVTSITDAEFATVLELDRSRGTARSIDEYRRLARSHGLGADLDLRGYWALVTDLERGRVVAIADVQADPLFLAGDLGFDLRGIRAILLVGAEIDDDALGLFALARSEIHDWSGEEIAFAHSIAAVLSQLFLIARHHEALTAMDLVEDAIFVERGDGRTVYANRPARALAGATAPGTAQVTAPRPTSALSGDRDVSELDWTRDGETRELELRRVRLPDGGLVTVVEDVTERKREARTRADLQARLEHAGRLEAIGELAGGIAHDFNNILGAIIGFARFLQEDLPVDAGERRFADRIVAAGERGKALVSQLLTFARAGTRERGPLDLRATIAENCQLFAAGLPPGLGLATQIAPDRLPAIANAGQIGQMLLNVCVNAKDAMEGRGGTIRISLAPLADASAEPVPLVGRLEPARRYAKLTIEDDGCGISPETQIRLFEPFFTTKERGRGTGLGLAMVHGILQSHEAACAIRSAPGAGTRFTIYLPLSETVELPEAAPPASPPPRGPERVLLVDDETDIADMMSIGLDRLGYDVAALNDPAEALEAISEAPHAWDIVVTDQLMPGIQGLELARRIKQIRPDLPIILCTGFSDETVGRLAREAGIHGVLQKPVEPSQLAGMIRSAALAG